MRAAVFRPRVMAANLGPLKQVNSTISRSKGTRTTRSLSIVIKGVRRLSIPGEKGDITRANIRFAMEDGKGGFTSPRTLNEIKDTARFPIIEFTPDNTLLVAWIDRRVDNPIPRSLYLMRISPTGQELTKSYKVGEALCECCRLGITFADAGKTVLHGRPAGRQNRFVIMYFENRRTAAIVSAHPWKCRRWLAGALLPARIPAPPSARMPGLSPCDLVHPWPL
jgi:hypothetical protein